MRKFWTVFVEYTDGGWHHKHSSFKSAKKEAERLAGLNQGANVYLFECIGRCYTTPVKWEILHEEIPWGWAHSEPVN